MVLNSPWFDLHGQRLDALARGAAVLNRVGLRQPMREIKREVTGFYARSLHRDHDGEWDFDLAWKPIQSFPVRAGWLRAIRNGHAAAAPRAVGRLPGPGPVLGRPSAPRDGRGRARPRHRPRRAQIRQWAPALGRHVTYVAVDGRPPRRRALAARAAGAVYDELERWRTAYVDGRGSEPLISGAMNPVTLLSSAASRSVSPRSPSPTWSPRRWAGRPRPPVLTQWFGNREIALGRSRWSPAAATGARWCSRAWRSTPPTPATAYAARPKAPCRRSWPPRDRGGGGRGPVRPARPPAGRRARRPRRRIVSPDSCGSGALTRGCAP